MTDGITAKVIEDSISEYGVRLTTLQLRFPRFILAEFNTHRQFTRNARSTRAVPTKKLIQEIRDSPVIPSAWLQNKPGMQATEPMDAATSGEAERLWREAANSAADYAEKLFALGLHKQWAGRVIEPFMYVDALVSSTHWANFDTLRDHEAAQPEIEILAKRIIEARGNNEPKLLNHGEWHLPFITLEERERVNGRSIIAPNDAALMPLLKLSTARCARISYRPFDGNDSIEKEFERYMNLVGSMPIHASPAEHQATPDTQYDSGSVLFPVKVWANPERHGNYFGFIQHRKLISNEYIADTWKTISK